MCINKTLVVTDRNINTQHKVHILSGHTVLLEMANTLDRDTQDMQDTPLMSAPSHLQIITVNKNQLTPLTNAKISVRTVCTAALHAT